MDLPRYWVPIAGDPARKLEAELARELSPLHPLYGQPVQAVARRPDRDDVLLKAVHDDRVHWVHLTWSVEKDPRWPRVESYRNIEDFRERWPREELYEGEDDPEDEDAG